MGPSKWKGKYYGCLITSNCGNAVIVENTESCIVFMAQLKGTC